MNARRIPKEELAEDVWLCLEYAREDGRTMDEIMHETGFSREQVKKGMAEINRALQQDKSQPIMVKTGTWKYVLPDHYVELLPWTLNRFGDLRTRAQTEFIRTEAAEARFPNEVPPVRKQLARLIEDLDELLNDFKESGTVQPRKVRIRKVKGK